MALTKVKTEMKGNSSRWSRRAIVKSSSRKRRRINGKKTLEPIEILNEDF